MVRLCYLGADRLPCCFQRNANLLPSVIQTQILELYRSSVLTSKDNKMCISKNMKLFLNESKRNLSVLNYLQLLPNTFIIDTKIFYSQLYVTSDMIVHFWLHSSLMLLIYTFTEATILWNRR